MRFQNSNTNAERPHHNEELAPINVKWESFWDLADPETASIALMEFYGAAAARAASACASAAIADGRNEDFRFWTTALSCIKETQSRNRQLAIARWEANGLCLI